MKMRSIMLFLMIGSFTIACNNTKKMAADSAQVFGEDFNGKNAMTLDALIAKLEKSGAIEDAVVMGKVEGVCQAKGCWMNLVSTNDKTDESVFVKFKDYGFFMPKDLAGGQVIMKGKAFTEETSVEELRHYAEDEGKSAEEIAAITQPKKELKFMASGVKIVKR